MVVCLKYYLLVRYIFYKNIKKQFNNLMVMKTVLVFPPFCTPASPSYSINYLASFLQKNGVENKVLDLNIKFHQLKFPEQYKYYQNFTENYDQDKYDEITKNFQKISSKVYSENNRKVINNELPELFEEMLSEITKYKLKNVAFSIVYSSQAFYTLVLIKELSKLGIKTIIGGPAVNSKLKSAATKHLNNEVELLQEILGEKVVHDKLVCDKIIDFDIKRDYFISKPVIPIKTSSSCFYQLCAFCSHHGKVKYSEYDLDEIKQIIINSKAKNFFFIDDMISTKRLLAISEMIKDLNVNWMCQLRPTIDLTKNILQQLYDSGLKIIIWGVESGNDRVLKLIRKGTNVKDLEVVLKNSFEVGITNVTYIMFGFPTETEEEFMDTINMLERNKEYISLVSTSVFGVHKDTPIYNEPEKYGVLKVIQQPRTVLEPKLSYSVKEGLTHDQVIKLKKKNMYKIEKINNFPKEMNYFREQMLCLVSSD